MISKEKLEYGAFQVVNNCLCVKKGERVCIVTDEKAYHIGKAIKEQTMKITDNVKLFKMEDFGKRSEDGSKPLAFPKEIGDYLKTCQVSVYAATGKKGELKSFRTPMLNIVTDLKKIRHGHMPGIDDTIMAMGMAADYAKIKEVNAKMFKVVKGAKRAKVTTALGTNFEVEFNPAWKWINCDGNIKAENWSNLPDGEILTCAKTANGRVIVDGVLGDYLCEKFGAIEKTPVIFDIKDGRVTNLTCSNKEIEAEIKQYIKQDENANRVGEFAIGTNLGLEKLIGNLLQDEKFPSVHISLGHGYPEQTGSDWTSEAHLDMVITKTNIEIDGKQIMKEGKFLV